MVCNGCGNNVRFVMVKETAFWNDETKKFEPVDEGDEYYLCEECNSGSIDTEGDY